MPFTISSSADSKYGRRFLSPEAAKSFEHTITGTVSEKPAPDIKPGMTDVPFDVGPQALERE